MGQFIPTVTEADVERILKRDFPAELHGEMMELFSQVDVREKPRVLVACMKNASGDCARLRQELGNASGYCREIISEAEYPKIKKSRNFTADEINEKRRAKYLQWFNRQE
jgi:hypothetical protein